jgi:hypothetical protein
MNAGTSTPRLHPTLTPSSCAGRAPREPGSIVATIRAYRATVGLLVLMVKGAGRVLYMDLVVSAHTVTAVVRW